MKIKVCGMRNAENIRELAVLAPDYIGFVFYEPSQRFAGELDGLTVQKLGKTIKTTGVFVNASMEEILEKIDNYRLAAIQLHGNESPDFCAQVKQAGVEVIKAFGMDASFDFNELNAYTDAVDFFLFDTKTSGYGGSGQTFNWDILKKYKLDKLYFLSGGLSLQNLHELSKLEDEKLYALDLNSRFETAPGLKDTGMLETAFGIIRNAGFRG